MTNEQTKEQLMEQIQLCYSLMEDSPSKMIFSCQVYYVLTGEYQYIGKMLNSLYADFPSCVSSPEIRKLFDKHVRDIEQVKPLSSFYVDRDNMFFEPSIVKLGHDEVFIDCGATDMGTSLEFAYQAGYEWKRIVAFEPDPVCHERCVDNLKLFPKEKEGSIKLYDYGVYDTDGVIAFERSTVLGDSRVIPGAGKENVRVRKIDSIPDCADATFIKIHVEGSGYEVLKGAGDTIKRMRPVLAVSCYHNINELVDIPIFLKQLVPDYHFYMRHYSTGTSESVLYAVTEKAPSRE